MNTQVLRLGRRDYEPVWRAMQSYTDRRQTDSPDQIWMVEHPPVFTVGMNGGMEHILAPGDIPVVHIDRGGQVTYHGPGQLVVYPLLDLRRKKMGIRELVLALENSIIDLLKTFDISAFGKRDAPGVYVAEEKIASLGLRVRRGSSYHGLAFNVHMDLEPFSRINPCGFAGLEVKDLYSLGTEQTLGEIADGIEPLLQGHLKISEPLTTKDLEQADWRDIEATLDAELLS